MYEYEEELEYLATNTFVCRCCGKIKNKNKVKKVVGWYSWRTCYVCPDCFKQLGLEERV